MDALQKLPAAGYETPFWMPSLWPSHLMFLSLTWQNGGEPYAEDGSEATFASEEGI
ncbi:MAG: transporter substrate-binding protein, partial [Actinotalea sp.]|nr:transporter substrate-binding protein [Actinotalea sp.]